MGKTESISCRISQETRSQIETVKQRLGIESDSDFLKQSIESMIFINGIGEAEPIAA